MPSLEEEDEFDTQYQASGVTTAPNADTDLVVVEVEKESQLSKVHITADETNNFLVQRRDQDGSNVGTVAAYVNTSDKAEGDFENPVAEAGAQKEYAVVNQNAGSSGQDYSVNLRVDEHTGK